MMLISSSAGTSCYIRSVTAPASVSKARYTYNTRSQACQNPAAGEWSLVPSKGDGRCLFRSLAQGHYRLRHQGRPLPSAMESSAADSLREKVCDRMLEVRSDLSPFINEDFDAYVAATRRPQVWGGEPELSVAAHVLERPIHVLDSQLKPVTQYAPTQAGTEGHTAEPVSLLFQRLGHYDLLIPNKPKLISKL